MSARSVSSYWPWLVGLLLLACLPFLRGAAYPLVFDDQGVIAENAFLHAPENFVRLFSPHTWRDPQVVDGMRPVVLATYFADHWAWGFWPAGFRLTNYLLHTANALLLFLLLTRRFSRSCGAALAGALLFAWHPLAVEAVHAPAFREDLLVLFFGLLLIFSATRTERAHGWIAGIPVYLLALGSKESAVVFIPLLATLWMFYPALRLSRHRRSALLGTLILLTLVFALALLGRGSVQSMGDAWNGVSLHGAERVWTPPWLFALTLTRLVAPFSLSVDYRIVPVTTWLDVRFGIGLLVIALVIGSAWRLRNRQPLLALGLVWLLLAFVPVSNGIPLFNPMADRYAYLLLPGLALLAALPPATVRRYAVPVVLALFFTASLARVGVWQSDRVLWESTLRVEPRSARAHVWLGLLDKEEGHPASAWEHFRAALELNPRELSALINQGVMLAEHGDYAGAEVLFAQALAIRPGHRQAAENYQAVRQLQGKPPDDPPGSPP